MFCVGICRFLYRLLCILLCRYDFAYVFFVCVFFFLCALTLCIITHNWLSLPSQVYSFAETLFPFFHDVHPLSLLPLNNIKNSQPETPSKFPQDPVLDLLATQVAGKVPPPCWQEPHVRPSLGNEYQADLYLAERRRVDREGWMERSGRMERKGVRESKNDVVVRALGCDSTLT